MHMYNWIAVLKRPILEMHKKVRATQNKSRAIIAEEQNIFRHFHELIFRLFQF